MNRFAWRDNLMDSQIPPRSRLFRCVETGYAVPFLLSLTLLLLPAQYLFAQAEDPFGASAKPAPAAPDEGKADKPSSGRFGEKDAIVLSIRESNPTTPEALLKAVTTLADVGRVDEAEKFLKQLLELKLDATALANLHAKVGSDPFSRLITHGKLGESATRFARSALEAAAAMARDPDQINRLIAKLTDPNEDTRNAAARALRAAGHAAIPPLLRGLADDRRASDHRAISQAFLRLGSEAVEPLIGVFESTDEKLKSRVIPILVTLRDGRVTQYLLRPALDSDSIPELREVAIAALSQMASGTLSKTSAEQFLLRRVREYSGGTLPVEVNHEGFGNLWHWDVDLKTTTSRRYHSRELSAVEASRVAHELYRLSPDNADYRRLFFTTRFEAEKLVGGIGRPLPRGKGTLFAAAADLGPDVMEDLLVHAHAKKNVPAIVAALEVLGEVGSPGMLVSADGASRPISKMLGHADRRVRFAAAEAVLTIDPKQTFVGASRLTDALGFFAGSVGARRVLVGHPNGIEAQTLVGLLVNLGYEADAVHNGRAFFQLAATRPDYELFLISDRIQHPTTSELLQALRQEPRTAGQVVGVLAFPQVVKFPDGALLLTDHDKKELREQIEAPTKARSKTVGAVAVAGAKANQTNDIAYEAPFGKTQIELLGNKLKRMSPVPPPSDEPVLRDELERWRQMLASDALAAAFLKPNREEEMAYVVQQLLDRGGRHVVSRDERLRHATVALDAFAKFSDHDHVYSFLEIRTQQTSVETALRTPELSAKAAKVLGNFGTPKAQQLLLDFASDRGNPLEARQAAAAAFREAVKRRGLLVTRASVLAQFDRYNRSEFQDVDTQKVLGSLLDVIEKKKTE